MRVLLGEEEKEAKDFIKIAINEAANSPCLKYKCGSVIVKDREVIGKGFNSTPLNKPIDKCIKASLPLNFKSDKHCCVHAEQRAIMDALKKNSIKIAGSRLYFIRTDLNGKMLFSGQPFCTICSKMALDAGISEFILWHENGITVYDTEEYNQLSFMYREER